MTSQAPAKFSPTPKGTFGGVVPLALGQIYLVWLVASGRMNFFEAVLMSWAEIMLTVVFGSYFLSPNSEVRTRRFHSLTGLIVMMTFMLYLSLTITTLTLRHYHDKPPGMLSEMYAVIVSALTGSTILYGGLYLLITIGLSALHASRNDDQMRSWYTHQFFPASMSLVALLATTFFGFFPTVMQAEDYPTRLNLRVSVELIALLGGFRVFFATVMIHKLTPHELEEMYTKFRAGDDRVEPRHKGWLPPPSQ